MLRLRMLAMLIVSCTLAGCFPIELDVKDGKVLIPRGEGVFVFDPGTGKTAKVAAPDGGPPVFARFAPDGKEVLLVTKSTSGYNEFKFVIAPLSGGKGREVFKGQNSAYVLYAPDGKSLGIIKVSDKQNPQFKQQMPDLLVVPTSGGKEKVVASNVAALFRWFSDSKRMLIFEIAKKDENSHYFGTLAVLDLESGKKRPLAAVAVNQSFFVDLAPNNKKALFTALRADKPGTNLEKGDGYKNLLFEVDLASGEVRKIDKETRYAIYSPSGAQVLLGTPPEGFDLTSLQLQVADAGLTKFTTVVTNAHMPLAIGGEGSMFPSWLDDKRLCYFVNRAVYGTEAKNVHLYMVGADGKGKRCVQPQIDMDVLKEDN